MDPLLSISGPPWVHFINGLFIFSSWRKLAKPKLILIRYGLICFHRTSILEKHRFQSNKEFFEKKTKTKPVEDQQRYRLDPQRAQAERIQVQKKKI